MPEPIEMTIENYMKVLEGVSDSYENRIHAQFVYVEKNQNGEWPQTCIAPSCVLKSVANLKVRFTNGEYSTRVCLSMNRRATLDDRNGLLSAANECMLNENKPFPDAETWVIIYEWYMKQCFAIKIDEIKTRKASCVIESQEILLMEQEMSVSERAMTRVWNSVKDK